MFADALRLVSIVPCNFLLLLALPMIPHCCNGIYVSGDDFTRSKLLWVLRLQVCLHFFFFARLASNIVLLDLQLWIPNWLLGVVYILRDNSLVFFLMVFSFSK